MPQQLSQERFVEIDDLRETYADLVFSVELVFGAVQVTLGVSRVDHRGQQVIRSSVPVARVVMPNATVRALTTALQAAVENMPKVTAEDQRAAITLKKPFN